MNRQQRLWFCLPPVALCLVDVGLTLAGQSADYWGGDYQSVVEWNPLARWLLAQHPLVFVVSIVVWLTAFSFVIVQLPWRLSRCLAFAILLGHAFGAATWLVMKPSGWVACVLVLLFAKMLDRFVLERNKLAQSPT